MKALILAAGFGKRLQPITNTIPKSMVSVNGVPLLENALNCLADLQIDEIGIVVGHMAEYIKKNIGTSWKGIPISFYENSRYLETNNVVSLYKAKEFCTDDMLLLECDLFYRKEMLSELLKGAGDCSILVSPFNKATMDGTVIEIDGDKAVNLVLGKWQAENYDYKNSRKTVNMYKFNKRFIEVYMKYIELYVNALGENSYYEKVLGSLLYLKEFDVRVVEIPESMWCEIDDVNDLKRAETKFK